MSSSGVFFIHILFPSSYFDIIKGTESESKTEKDAILWWESEKLCKERMGEIV